MESSIPDIRFNDIVRSLVDIHTGRRHYSASSKSSGACIGVRDGKVTFWILSGVFAASGDFTTDLKNIELVRRPSETNDLIMTPEVCSLINKLKGKQQ